MPVVNRFAPGLTLLLKSGPGLPTGAKMVPVLGSSVKYVQTPPPPCDALAAFFQVVAPVSLSIGIVENDQTFVPSPTRYAATSPRTPTSPPATPMKTRSCQMSGAAIADAPVLESMILRSQSRLPVLMSSAIRCPSVV